MTGQSAAPRTAPPDDPPRGAKRERRLIAKRARRAGRPRPPTISSPRHVRFRWSRSGSTGPARACREHWCGPRQASVSTRTRSRGFWWAWQWGGVMQTVCPGRVARLRLAEQEQATGKRHESAPAGLRIEIGFGGVQAAEQEKGADAWRETGRCLLPLCCCSSESSERPSPALPHEEPPAPAEQPPRASKHNGEVITR